MANGHGGRRSNAGRRRSPESIERSRVERLIQQRRVRVADRVFNAQLALAEGTSYVYEIVTGENGKAEHVLVTDPNRIKDFLDDGARGETHMYITVEKPDGKMITDIFDRAFGKAVQSIEAKIVDAEDLLANVLDLGDDDINAELADLRAADEAAAERERARAAVGASAPPSIN